MTILRSNKQPSLHLVVFREILFQNIQVRMYKSQRQFGIGLFIKQ